MRLHPVYAIHNTSTVLTDDEIVACLPMFKHAMDYWFEPHWNATGSLILGDATGTNIRTIEILDTSDQAGALGYHYDDKGNSILRIFAKTDLQYGYDWRVTFMHEVFEDLADSSCLLASQDPSPTKNEFYGFETGDPVEADKFALVYQGVPISDFVLPAWFTGDPGPYDYGRFCSMPLQVLSGGYVSIYQNGKWTSFQQQQTGLVEVSDDHNPDKPRVRNRNKRIEQLREIRMHNGRHF